MQTLHNHPRSDSYDQKPSRSGNAQSAPPGVSPIKALIQRANSIPLPIILKHYGRQIDEHNPKSQLVCPLPKHMGTGINGREDTGSFKYYPESNTFWCFGCKTGTTVCIFIANMEGVNQTNAARKAIELFGKEVISGNENGQEHNYSERLEIMMSFSNYMREFIQAHSNDPKSQTHIEDAARAFDEMMDKYAPDNTTLMTLVSKLKEKVGN